MGHFTCTSTFYPSAVSVAIVRLYSLYEVMPNWRLTTGRVCCHHNFRYRMKIMTISNSECVCVWTILCHRCIAIQLRLHRQRPTTVIAILIVMRKPFILRCHSLQSPTQFYMRKWSFVFRLHFADIAFPHPLLTCSIWHSRLCLPFVVRSFFLLIHLSSNLLLV